MNIGTLLQANLRADLRPASDADGAKHITLNAEVRPQLQELIPLLLTDQLKSLSLRKQAGQDLVKVNVQGKLEGFTALMTAAAEGQLDVVRLLLAYGADPGLEDKDGDTAASFARQNGHSAVVDLLENPPAESSARIR